MPLPTTEEPRASGPGNTGRHVPTDQTVYAQWRSAWLSTTIRNGWTDVAAWHLPVVDTVIRSAYEGRPYQMDLLSLAEQRAELGCGLDETLQDVHALLEVLAERGRRSDDPFTIARLAAVGWHRAAIHRSGQSCHDPLTHLATDVHLVRRADEIYRQAAASGAQPEEVLVFLTWPRAACGPNHIAARIAVAGTASAFFDAGETVARVGGHAIVALCPSAPPPHRLQQLAADVDMALDGCVRSRVVVMPLPATLAELADLVADHSHAGAPVPCRGPHAERPGKAFPA